MTYLFGFVLVYWLKTGSVDTNDLILIHVRCPFHICDVAEKMMMKVLKEKSSLHPLYDLDAKNELMVMVMLLMMNDMNDNYVDDVHELFQEFVQVLYNVFSMVQME
jgi:hypothetical protein